MQVTTQAEGWRVVAPSRRFDIAIEEDLIEELATLSVVTNIYQQPCRLERVISQCPVKPDSI